MKLSGDVGIISPRSDGSRNTLFVVSRPCCLLTVTSLQSVHRLPDAASVCVFGSRLRPIWRVFLNQSNAALVALAWVRCVRSLDEQLRSQKRQVGGTVGVILGVVLDGRKCHIPISKFEVRSTYQCVSASVKHLGSHLVCVCTWFFWRDFRVRNGEKSPQIWLAKTPKFDSWLSVHIQVLVAIGRRCHTP